MPDIHPELFWSRVDTDGPCWEWTSSKNSSGYGSYWCNGKLYSAHRVAAWLSGIVPTIEQPDRRGDGHVLHRCDNRLCCRPDHLYSGTLAQNHADCLSRGRLNRSTGSAHTNAKMSPISIAEVLGRRRNGETYTDIAKDYAVHRSTISNIVNGRNYKDELSVTSRGVVTAVRL
jgi:Zinc-binding loop region of homing endonuclease